MLLRWPELSCSQHVWLSAAAVIATVIVCLMGSGWWLLGPLGQIATRDDFAQLRAEIRAELVAGTRARQRMVDEIGRLVREADPG